MAPFGSSATRSGTVVERMREPARDSAVRLGNALDARAEPRLKRPRMSSLALAEHPWGICFLMLAAQLVVSASAAAQSTPAAGNQSPPLMDRQKEIALALSACPPSVASKAAVYVLEKSGYLEVRGSQNGFTAIVERSSLPTSQAPQCIDAEGTRTFLPRLLKEAQLRAQGKSREEIRRFDADAFANGLFKPPMRPGIDYMLSTENMLPIDEDKGLVAPFPPHVMFYGPYLTAADLGSDDNSGGPVSVINEGTPHALIIVPVPTHKSPGHASADKR
jgi:hypothetical protein